MELLKEVDAPVKQMNPSISIADYWTLPPEQQEEIRDVALYNDDDDLVLPIIVQKEKA